MIVCDRAEGERAVVDWAPWNCTAVTGRCRDDRGAGQTMAEHRLPRSMLQAFVVVDAGQGDVEADLLVRPSGRRVTGVAAGADVGHLHPGLFHAVQRVLIELDAEPTALVVGVYGDHIDLAGSRFVAQLVDEKRDDGPP